MNSSILVMKSARIVGVLFFAVLSCFPLKAEEVLFQDDFSGDLSRWVVEQTPSGKTRVIDGELDIDDAPGTHDKGGCTVWFKEKISGPVRITYDATMVQKGGPNDRLSDLNCFWMASDPKNPEDLFVG
ncbi:MAG: hypothetical protein EBY81_01075, partial [Verrucomicrobia bacterium]|nr:hypothetical protein [Verrucomicrobiota bacterium]